MRSSSVSEVASGRAGARPCRGPAGDHSGRPAPPARRCATACAAGAAAMLARVA